MIESVEIRSSNFALIANLRNVALWRRQMWSFHRLCLWSKSQWAWNMIVIHDECSIKEFSEKLTALRFRGNHLNFFALKIPFLVKILQIGASKLYGYVRHVKGWNIFEVHLLCRYTAVHCNISWKKGVFFTPTNIFIRYHQL